MPAKKRRLGLAEQVLIGLVLGIVAGVFFGQRVAFLSVGGQAFIMLLQMTAIPYILVSLITALGRLSLADAKTLGLKAGTILLGLWAIGLVIVLLSPLAFPDWLSASFFSTSQVEEAKAVDFLQLYIPANPFFSLANAVVPAIVVFSVLIGLALTSVDNKEALLKPLSAFGDTLMGVAGIVGRLAPYGIFALVASAAGTIDVGDLNRLQVYVVVYVAMALILSFWVLPGLVAAFTPLRHADVVRTFRGPLLVAFATANLLIILPILASDCKKLLESGAPRRTGAEETEAESSVDVLIPAAYPFPTLGLVLSLIFVLFAGWYIGASVSIAQYPAIASAGLASLFGSTPIAIPFLLDLLQLPQDLFQVFLTVDVIGSRFGTLLAAMHIITIALIGTVALQGALRVRKLSLLRTAGISVALVAAALIGIRAFYTFVVVAPYTKDEALRSLQFLGEPQPATVRTDPADDPGDASPGGPSGMSEITARGVLRVCFSPDDYPSAFFNEQEPPQLVGFDIEMAHRFARQLGVSIDFLPTETDALAAARLASGACDVSFTTRVVSAPRVEQFAMTPPVYQASAGLIVRDHRRDEFRRWADLRAMGPALRLGMVNKADTIANARAVLPQASLVLMNGTDDQRRLLETETDEVDAIADLSEEGAAWSLLYPRYSLVVPKPTYFLPVSYSVAPSNTSLLQALNAWMLAEKSKGTVDELYRYWMLGEAETEGKPPRWSVIRDVLHWVD